MAVRKIYVSDIDQKTELNESDVVTIRLQDGSGDWFSLDMTDDQYEKHFGKYLNEETKITKTVMEEQTQKLDRMVRAKVESGELIDASSVRGQTRKQSVNTASGKTPEELSAIRQWAKDNGHEVSDRGRIKADIVKAYEEAKGGKVDA